MPRDEWARANAKQRHAPDPAKYKPPTPRRKSMQRCPLCRMRLTLIRNTKTGSQFYGCTAYPKCRYTRSKGATT